jgi:hypothetical protein
MLLGPPSLPFWIVVDVVARARAAPSFHHALIGALSDREVSGRCEIVKRALARFAFVNRQCRHVFRRFARGNLAAPDCRRGRGSLPSGGLAGLAERWRYDNGTHRTQQGPGMRSVLWARLQSELVVVITQVREWLPRLTQC